MDNFCEFLRAELVRRCKSNTKYSLRSFARYLNLEPSYLSKILNGKRSVTEATFRRISKRLPIPAASAELFLKQISKKTKSDVKQVQQRKQLALDHFHMISDWKHIAILELFSVRDFQVQARSCAKALGCSVYEASSCIERLCRLELLEQSSEGYFPKDKSRTTATDPLVTSAALMKLQKQYLEKSIHALECIPLELREHGGATFALDSTLMTEAKQKLLEFRREFMSEMECKGSPNQVYQLTVSLFPLTEI